MTPAPAGTAGQRLGGMVSPATPPWLAPPDQIYPTRSSLGIVKNNPGAWQPLSAASSRQAMDMEPGLVPAMGSGHSHDGWMSWGRVETLQGAQAAAAWTEARASQSWCGCCWAPACLPGWGSLTTMVGASRWRLTYALTLPRPSKDSTALWMAPKPRAPTTVTPAPCALAAWGFGG